MNQGNELSALGVFAGLQDTKLVTWSLVDNIRVTPLAFFSEKELSQRKQHNNLAIELGHVQTSIPTRILSEHREFDFD